MTFWKHLSTRINKKDSILYNIYIEVYLFHGPIFNQFLTKCMSTKVFETLGSCESDDNTKTTAINSYTIKFEIFQKKNIKAPGEIRTRPCAL